MINGKTKKMENGSNDNDQPKTVVEAEERTTSECNDNSVANTEEEEHNKGGTMKLVIRSPYWGRVLKGKTRRDPANPTRPYRIFQCQAVLSNEGRYWGCCPNHGKRVFELKEYHFTETYPHDWDLYMMGSSVTPTNIVHSFFLLPQNQTSIDVNSRLHYEGWTYVGTMAASQLRLDLEALLYDFLIPNKDYGYHFHHVHLDLLMDEVTDREAVHSRQKTEARRAEKLANRANKTTQAQQPNIGNQPPPIPHVVSNDASWATDTTRSSSTVSTGGGVDNWNDAFHPAYGYRSPAGHWPNPHAQWIAAAARSNGGNDSLGLNRVAAPGPMPPMQQALQSFPMPMMNNLPPIQLGFVPPPYYVPQLEHTAAVHEQGWGGALATDSGPYTCPPVGVVYGEPVPAPQDSTAQH